MKWLPKASTYAIIAQFVIKGLSFIKTLCTALTDMVLALYIHYVESQVNLSIQVAGEFCIISVRGRIGDKCKLNRDGLH